MSEVPRELERRRAFWLEHARRSEQGDESIETYAAAHELSVKALYRWRGRARREGLLMSAPAKPNTSGFVRLDLHSPRESLLRIGLPNGCTVELSGALDSALLASVLRETAAL